MLIEIAIPHAQLSRMPDLNSLVKLGAADSGFPNENRPLHASVGVIETFDTDHCIFDLAYPFWIRQPSALERVDAIWQKLHPSYRKLINGVFLWPSVLRDFLLAPSSVRYHHAFEGGNFIHSLEVAELCLIIAARMPRIDVNVLITAALLHDVGKSMEYVRAPGGGWEVSEKGKFVGHKLTTLQMATLAFDRVRSVSRRQKDRIVHAIMATYAPDWSGLPKPLTPEAMVLSMCDRLSARQKTFQNYSTSIPMVADDIRVDGFVEGNVDQGLGKRHRRAPTQESNRPTA